MSDPVEYLKLKYMGDCKCGNCQLVPPEQLVRWDHELTNLRSVLGQFLAACDTAPPTSLMTEISMAANAARIVLTSRK